MRTVALDAMGSDGAPEVEVEGAIQAAQSGQVRVILVGDPARLSRELERKKATALPIEIRPATEVIGMEDSPATAARRKRNSSMRIAVDLVARQEADAVVSAGNSGAMMACAVLGLRRMKGVDRPALLSTLPSRGKTVALLDVGANVDCKAENLTQFALMGACYARAVLGQPLPRVGLLSNGVEEHKGTRLTREANQALETANLPGLNYVGYIEGRDVFVGAVDVVVCDGFTGNLVIKVAEGVAEALVAVAKEVVQSSVRGRLLALGLMPEARRMAQRVDFAEWGGALLVGVKGAAFVCHGASNSKAIKNALLNAATYVRQGSVEAMAEAVRSYQGLGA